MQHLSCKHIIFPQFLFQIISKAARTLWAHNLKTRATAAAVDTLIWLLLSKVLNVYASSQTGRQGDAEYSTLHQSKE